jgi:hypothetical protein
VEYIERGAFGGCKKLSTITIPATVKYIGDYAFSGCTGLRTIYFLGNAPEYRGNFPFEGVTAKAYYPKDNATWQDPRAFATFNDHLTWVPNDGVGSVCPVGDASGDGIIDSYDATLILQYDVGMIHRADMSNAELDVSGDGIVDSYDATLILQFDVGMIPEVPAA